MGISLRHFPAVAQAFEQNGIESLWIPEHLVFPANMPPTYPYADGGPGLPPVTSDTHSYDPWAVLSYIAATTTTIRLATNVFVLPLRHPLAIARSVVTVDRLSRGRVTLGAGVGWLEDEFNYVREPFRTRGKRADAIIGILRQLWSEDVIEVHDEHFDFGPVKFQPKPLQRPSIPIEVGGAARGALLRAGRLGDGWIEIGAKDLDEFRTRLKVVLDAREEAGRTGPFEVTVPISLAPAPGIDGLRRLRDAGATRVIMLPDPEAVGHPTAGGRIDWSKRFADEVIARFDD
ncbi:TIGR03619 family F420-dependent LLM class oxidoreductase [Frankia gtarii]|uniref:TIGR03619 family F420-dependent LLM class oxidoreductase n=1 Tax=Frankia gtarii TaxID=2950102 RepID=UPI0021C16D15|nr:TIGR03619 family F420-dependent LLM class oxidoreductase [Frankia gtarii]